MELVAVIVVVLVLIGIANANKKPEPPKVRGVILEKPQGGCVPLLLVILTFFAAAGVLLARM